MPLFIWSAERNQGGAAIYDPSGSYSRSIDPHNGDMIEGDAASIERFSDFQKDFDGSTTDVTCQETTKAEEQRLFKEALLEGPKSGPYCAYSVSNVLFESIWFPYVSPGTWLPGKLFRDASR